MCQFFFSFTFWKKFATYQIGTPSKPLGLVCTVPEILDPPPQWVYTQYLDHFQVPIVLFRNHLVELSHTIIHFYQVELRAVDLVVSVFTHVYRRAKSLLTIVGNVFRNCPITFNTILQCDVLRDKVESLWAKGSFTLSKANAQAM